MVFSAAITPPSAHAGPGVGPGVVPGVGQTPGGTVIDRSRLVWVLAVSAFTILFVAAALVGRATAVQGQSLSLVWPAAGVAVIWFLTLTRRSEVVASVVVVTAATGVVNLLTRSSSSLDLIPVFVAANLMQVGAVVLLVRRWCPELGRLGGRPPLETPESLLRFLIASALGCLAGVVVGVAGLNLVDASVSPLSALAWWGRNVCGVLAVGTTGLLLVHRLMNHGRSARQTGGGALEALALIAVTVGLVGLDYVSGPPFSFLLPATSVWAGLRFSPLLTSCHALLGGIAVIWLTLTDHGLFAGSASGRSGVLLAQLFVGMMLMIGLFLAAGRSESNRLHARLDERQRELEAFARRAAHDLQQPLIVIDGWAGLLDAHLSASSDDRSQPVREVDMVHRIQGGVAQMSDLVANLLADATARDREMAKEQVDLARLARGIAESRGALDVVQVGEIPPVEGDEQLLHALLDNLIGNALKYVAPGERARVEVNGRRELDRMVSVSVTDNGVGIPEGNHEAIFEEFTRAHGDAYPGTGLGLSISRRIVERHGGDIFARSRGSGPGTIFEFRLPMWRSPDGNPRTQTRSSALANSERHR